MKRILCMAAVCITALVATAVPAQASIDRDLHTSNTVTIGPHQSYSDGWQWNYIDLVWATAFGSNAYSGRLCTWVNGHGETWRCSGYGSNSVATAPGYSASGQVFVYNDSNSTKTQVNVQLWAYCWGTWCSNK